MRGPSHPCGSPTGTGDVFHLIVFAWPGLRIPTGGWGREHSSPTQPCPALLPPLSVMQRQVAQLNNPIFSSQTNNGLKMIKRKENSEDSLLLECKKYSKIHVKFSYITSIRSSICSKCLRHILVVILNFLLIFLLLFSPSKQFTINRSLPCGYRLKSLVTNLKTMEPLPDQNNLFKILSNFIWFFTAIEQQP